MSGNVCFLSIAVELAAYKKSCLGWYSLPCHNVVAEIRGFATRISNDQVTEKVKWIKCSSGNMCCDDEGLGVSEFPK